MKHLKLILGMAMVIGINACNTEVATDDTKAIAEEHNEAKYNEKSEESDAQFLVNAAEMHLAEIQLGVLAKQSSKNADIISLGTMMEESHGKSLKDLEAIASRKLITLPTASTDKSNEMISKLKSKKGNEFNKEYCDLMVSIHTDAITIFENASSSSSDIEIKSWASSLLPILRTHLDRAITCQKQFDTNK